MFVVTGQVVWLLAAAVAVTALLGGLAGSTLARRLPAPALRAAVVGLGLVVAGSLLR